MVDHGVWNSLVKLGGWHGSGMGTYFNGWINIFYPYITCRSLTISIVIDLQRYNVFMIIIFNRTMSESASSTHNCDKYRTVNGGGCSTDYSV